MLRKIIYVNASNEVSYRNLEVIDEDERYIIAVGVDGGPPKTFRKDRVLEDVASIDDPGVAKKVEGYQRRYAIIPNASREQWTNRQQKPEICFTGFRANEKAILMQHAEERGFFVRASVSGSLKFLVCGDTAGPSKMKSAREQGAFILGRDDYYRLAATGELPIE
jgi:NAD-dependent DNA ligase